MAEPPNLQAILTAEDDRMRVEAPMQTEQKPVQPTPTKEDQIIKLLTQIDSKLAMLLGALALLAGALICGGLRLDLF